MPMIWERSRNPYRYSAFRMLGLGPHATDRQVVAQSHELVKKLRAAGKTRADDDVDEHAVGAAARCLRNPRSLIEELLLTHHLRKLPEHRQREKLAKELRQVARPVFSLRTPPLRSRFAVFWFTPVPGRSAVPRPTGEELELPSVGGAEDRELDIVFAGTEFSPSPPATSNSGGRY